MSHNLSSAEEENNVDEEKEISVIEGHQNLVKEPLLAVGDLNQDEEVWILNVPVHVSWSFIKAYLKCSW